MLSRKVKIYEWKKENVDVAFSKMERVKTGVGLFHQWGCDFEEFEGGPGNYTTAIVEMEDGVVKNVPVEDVEFIL